MYDLFHTTIPYNCLGVTSLYLQNLMLILSEWGEAGYCSMLRIVQSSVTKTLGYKSFGDAIACNNAIEICSRRNSWLISLPMVKCSGN
jgi:hypothetical protein